MTERKFARHLWVPVTLVSSPATSAALLADIGQTQVCRVGLGLVVVHDRRERIHRLTVEQEPQQRCRGRTFDMALMSVGQRTSYCATPRMRTFTLSGSSEAKNAFATSSKSKI